MRKHINYKKDVKFCTYCGRDLIDYVLCTLFDKSTGEEVQYIERQCSVGWFGNTFGCHYDSNDSGYG